MLTALWRRSFFPDEKTEGVLWGHPPDFPLHTCGPVWGVSWSPPSAGPLQSLDGGVSALHRERRPGPGPPTLSYPVLSWVRTYLAGPRARCGHRPRSSFPGSGRVPAAALQEPVPSAASGPIARRRLQLHPIRAGGAGDRLRVPPPGLQHPSDRGPGRGGASACCSGSPGGKTPRPRSSPQGGSGLGASWGGGKPKSKSRPPTRA